MLAPFFFFCFFLVVVVIDGGINIRVPAEGILIVFTKVGAPCEVFMGAFFAPRVVIMRAVAREVEGLALAAAVGGAGTGIIGAGLGLVLVSSLVLVFEEVVVRALERGVVGVDVCDGELALARVAGDGDEGADVAGHAVDVEADTHFGGVVFRSWAAGRSGPAEAGWVLNKVLYTY